MRLFTQEQKKALQALVESGKQVSTAAYDPRTVVGDPVAKAISEGWVIHYREDTPTLVEVIFTR